MVKFSYHANIADWLEHNDLPIVALEQTPTSQPLNRYRPPEKFALLLGEEVDGVDPDLLAMCQATVEIPMLGQKESFNVSVACGIALYSLTVGLLDSHAIVTE